VKVKQTHSTNTRNNQWKKHVKFFDLL